MRRGFTLVEALVVLAIFATLAGLLLPVILTAVGVAPPGRDDREPPVSWSLLTVQHDRHWWVKTANHFVHHPDCPCREKNAEAADE